MTEEPESDEMEEWKIIESEGEELTRWANYKEMLEIRVEKLLERLYAVSLLKGGVYGPAAEEDTVIYADTVRGELIDVARKVKYLKENWQDEMPEIEKEKEENVTA